MNLSVIGLGKLGSPMLAVFANAGFYVVGVDSDPAVVDAINDGRAPVQEADLQDYLTRNRGGYRATMDAYQAVMDTDATFIIVPTPTGADGGFVLDYVFAACMPFGEALRDKTAWHLIVITSTVMPGHMRHVCAELERISGKREGVDFGLCYSPEFIALGSVIRDFTHPDYALIGAESDTAGAALESIYNQVHHAPKVRMNWVNAEIAKIAQNSYITMKITFANQLSQLCGHIPGANVDDVTRALGHDSRIGPKYLKGGTAFGGPCFPRDNRAIQRAAKLAGGDLKLARLIDELNGTETVFLLSSILETTGGAVGILGLSYKPGTPVVEESAGVDLAFALAMAEREVIVYDPLAMDEARKVLGDSVEYAESKDELLEKADVIVLMHDDYLPGSTHFLVGKSVIDPWRALTIYTDCYEDMTYIPLGIGPREAVTA